MAQMQHHVLAFLEDPRTHGGASVTRIDTHAAVVFLAGDNAYKVKRSVCLPYMDLSMLAQRHASCLAELSVNRTYAPQIYRAVVPITADDAGALHLGGEGRAVEWAVCMRRFDERQTLDHLAERGEISSDLIRELAKRIAETHRAAPVFADTPVEENFRRYVQDNDRAFQQVQDCLNSALMQRFNADMLAGLDAHAALLQSRCATGSVRRCHGDLHLRNLAMIDGVPTLFDAIEFDESIATIDVLYDLAFLLMDLMQRGLRAEANQLLNRYLWEMREDRQLSGVPLLPFFISLRAAIRAKIAIDTFVHLNGPTLEARKAEMQEYVTFAVNALKPTSAYLVAVGGLSGTGKSSVAAHLAPWIGRGAGAVHLRSDLERKHLFHAEELDRLPPTSYTPDASDRVYRRLREKAGEILQAGDSVIVDAVYLTEAERTDIAGVARRSGAIFRGLWLDAPTDLRLARVGQRKNDASDATDAVVRWQSGMKPSQMDWHQIDASQDLQNVVQAALTAIRQ